MLADPGHCLALGFGSGLAPRAPGTAGTVVAIGVYLLLAPLPLAAYLAVVGVLFTAGCVVAGRTARALGQHDHGAIVVDEIVGYLLTVTFCSTGGIGLAAGFLAFRFFDIFKPWPIKAVDRRVGGGFGIMADDVLAAGYAMIFLELFEYFSLSYKLFE